RTEVEVRVAGVGHLPGALGLPRLLPLALDRVRVVAVFGHEANLNAPGHQWSVRDVGTPASDKRPIPPNGRRFRSRASFLAPWMLIRSSRTRRWRSSRS